MMMNNFNSFGMGGFGLGIHWFFSLALLLGLILFVVWAVRTLKKEDLGKWAGWLIGIGLLGSLLTASFGFGGWGSHMRGSGWGGFMQGNSQWNTGMWNCMQDEECHEQMDTFMGRMMGITEDEK